MWGKYVQNHIELTLLIRIVRVNMYFVISLHNLDFESSKAISKYFPQ